MTSFDKLGLSGVLLRNIRQLGFTEPSSVQKSCIPPILQGRDVIGIANTGSGKTAAFALPVVHVLSVDPHGVFALCLSPTRELAYQLASNEVVCMEDLAELAVPELLDIAPDIGEEEAAQLIMIAREPWFAEAEAADAESA